jgi:NAD(P)-dependent dehydrogenase (short-subunit alcohol dehydrogenase family)
MDMTTESKPLCVITGACGSLGWSITKQLTASGLHILAIDLPEVVERRKNETTETGISFMSLDLMFPHAADAILDAVAAMGRSLRVLVNNAAFTGDAPLRGYACAFDDQTDEAFDSALTLNLAVPFRLARRLAPALRGTEGSVIINIASIYGLVGPDPRMYESTSIGNPAGYSASKGGLIQLTRYLSTVLAPEVRVNCIAPGGLARGQDPTFVERYKERTPLRRMGTEQEIADAVEWLASDNASYLTGQTIAVDGGWTAW